MRIIDGRAIAQKIRAELKKKIAAYGVKPGVAAILVGDDPASRLYVSLKERAAAEAGVRFEKHSFSKNFSENEILKKITQLNDSPSIHGILIQLPLPPGLDTDKIIAGIDPAKDADGFHPENRRRLKSGETGVEPIIAKAVWRLIEEALKETAEKENLSALIIGKSDVFTETLEDFLRQKGLRASHQHPERMDVSSIRNADIVIVAAGRPNFLRGEHFKDGAVVIDVGISRLPDGRLAGDIDFESTKQKNGWITPVPGGVGPVTVAMLLENVFLLALRTRPLRSM